MKLFKVFFSGRYGLAAGIVLISVLMSIILGGLFSLIAGTFWYCTQWMFWFFGAPCVTGALLLIFTAIEEDLSFGFGCGLYYGTAFAIKILSNFSNTIVLYFAGFLVAALVCYAVYKNI